MTTADAGPGALDRRECHRPRYFAEVEVEWGSAKLRARTSDISLGGMLLEMESPLQEGAEFLARLSVGEGAPLEANCVVKQVVPGACMGVEFTELKPADHARLRQLIESLPH